MFAPANAAAIGPDKEFSPVNTSAALAVKLACSFFSIVAESTVRLPTSQSGQAMTGDLVFDGFSL
jgi:hypothetical protein